MWLIIAVIVGVGIGIYVIRTTPDWNMEPLKQWLRQNEADKDAAKRPQERPDTRDTDQG